MLVRCRLFLLAALCFVSTSPSWAGEACRADGKYPPPQYPGIARRMKIAGTVRLEVQVGANGAAQTIQPLGGNPILVTAAEDWARHVRFATPGACVLSFEFK